MAQVKGRAKRQAPRGAPTVLLQARVDPDTRELARQGADAAGISIAAYMEKLLQADHQHHFVRPDSAYRQEALDHTA